MCNHITRRISSDVPDYFQCEVCGKQWRESQLPEFSLNKEYPSGDTFQLDNKTGFTKKIAREVDNYQHE